MASAAVPPLRMGDWSSTDRRMPPSVSAARGPPQEQRDHGDADREVGDAARDHPQEGAHARAHAPAQITALEELGRDRAERRTEQQARQSEEEPDDAADDRAGERPRAAAA